MSLKFKSMKNMIFNKLLFLFSITLFAACTNKQQAPKHSKVVTLSENEQVLTYFKEQGHPLQMGKQKVLVISDYGCYSCNKKFATLAEDFLADSTTYILISMSPERFDVLKFEQSKSKNLIFDHSIDYDKYPYLKKSKAIFLNNQNIDSTIVISIDKLDEKLERIGN